MNPLRIFVDLAMPPEVLNCLREGTQGHELIFPQKLASSVLAKGQPDPQFASVDIALGQPDLQAIAEAPNLKFIQVTSAGITRYDTPGFRASMTQRKIAVCNSSSVYSDPCAAHLLSFMLAQARVLPLGLKTRTKGGSQTWQSLRYSSSTLRGETVLILGFGAIGKRLVELLEPFGMHIKAYRRQPRGDENVPVIAEAELPQALAEADHVVNILPEGLDSVHFFNAERFAAMKAGAIFYNIGRGATVDQQALLEALRSERVKAAWLDVTTPEPLPDDHPLWAEPNCFITPHIAGGHGVETKSLVMHFLNNFERFLKGQSLVDRVI